MPNDFLGGLKSQYGFDVDQSDEEAFEQGRLSEEDIRQRMARRGAPTASEGGSGGDADVDGDAKIDSGWFRHESDPGEARFSRSRDPGSVGLANTTASQWVIPEGMDRAGYVAQLESQWGQNKLPGQPTGDLTVSQRNSWIENLIDSGTPRQATDVSGMGARDAVNFAPPPSGPPSRPNTNDTRGFDLGVSGNHRYTGPPAPPGGPNQTRPDGGGMGWTGNEYGGSRGNTNWSPPEVPTRGGVSGLPWMPANSMDKPLPNTPRDGGPGRIGDFQQNQLERIDRRPAPSWMDLPIAPADRANAPTANPITVNAPNDPRMDALIDQLSQRATQALGVDRNSAAIRPQADAYAAAEERARRNYVSDTAESQGPLANIQGESRLAAERMGQRVGSFESELIGREMQNQRDEISEALDSLGNTLTEQQRMDLEGQLASIDANLQSRGLDLTERGQDLDADFRRRGQDLERYGIDTDRDLKERGMDIQQFGISMDAALKEKGLDLQKYGIDLDSMLKDKGLNIQQAGQQVDAELRQRGIDLQRYGIDINAMIAQQGLKQDWGRNLMNNDQFMRELALREWEAGDDSDWRWASL